MRVAALCLLLLPGCVLLDPIYPPSPRPQTVCLRGRPAAQPSREDVLDAARRYGVGADADVSEPGRAAYRKVCLDRQDERGEAIDELHEHAQEHLQRWRDWYRENCSGDGYAVIDRVSGLSTTGIVCDRDAGEPPARLYRQTPAEQLARRQRDACARAW